MGYPDRIFCANAYHIVPVHVPGRLPVITRHEIVGDVASSAWTCLLVSGQPHISSHSADLVEWIAKQNYGVNFLIHYLDNVHTLVPPGSKARESNLARSIDYLSTLNTAFQPNNLEGPSTCLTIRGIKLNNPVGTCRYLLPQEIFERITAVLVDVSSQKRFCK